MKHVKDTSRYASVLRLLPNLTETSNKNILYIGAHPGRMQLIDLVENNNNNIDILEIFENNVKEISKLGYNVIHGDIRIYNINQYDIIIWWHGPEHVEMSTLDNILIKLEMNSKLVILGCPWGNVEQGPVYGNIHEQHINMLSYDYFESRGYNVECLGEKNIMGNCIVAIKGRI